MGEVSAERTFVGHRRVEPGGGVDKGILHHIDLDHAGWGSGWHLSAAPEGVRINVDLRAVERDSDFSAPKRLRPR